MRAGIQMKLMFKFKRYLKSCKLDFSYRREFQEILTVNAKNKKRNQRRHLQVFGTKCKGPDGVTASKEYQHLTSRKLVVNLTQKW